MNGNSIMFIGDFVDVGGAGKMIKFVANEMSNYYEKVFLFSLCQTETPKGLSKKVFFIPGEVDANFSLSGRIALMKSIRNTVKIISPTIVCSFTSEIATMVRISTIGVSTIIVSAERGDPYSLPFIWKNLTRIAYHYSDACIFQLERQKDFFCKSVKKKSYVIPNPFLLSTSIPVYEGERNKTIVSAGRFVPEKGFDVLISAFSIVHDLHPDYSLILWGEGPLLVEYKKQLSRLGLLDYVSFPGYSTNVAESVRKEGIFVLSSRYEGIPNVLIEAMSVGIPVVATNCSPGGPQFLTGEGERGLIVPMNDSQAMAIAINNIIENVELYHKLEKKGPEIRTILDKEVISKMWRHVFEDIV